MAPTRHGAIPRLATVLMLAGSALLLATALLATASILLRWFTGQPIPGDFELVQIGSGLAVFGFLAHGTLMRANILVDSFTGWLPARINEAVDAGWNILWAVITALLAWRMALGAADAWFSGTRSMVLGVAQWWAIALGSLCFAATALAAFWTAWHQWKGSPAGAPQA
ncbi:TRAP transporter small permease [Teichococcus vastitatis]|uniref:TRAP transporter small permease protein n=1 Tax=Teichococcus vastitatis TaxID=2307076 RepID=A0ABS9W0Q5_9PROT|nr:TRAP transporter small permease subunit [Pseudoroseomonas vastitatis]MCI0752773.1 TRAP transporter small permease [Pseudoroseomonas vastitatis]